MDTRNYLGYDPEPDNDGGIRRLWCLFWLLAGVAIANIPDAVRELLEMYYR